SAASDVYKRQEIRRYNRRQNIICRECRQSEVMQRVLAFY
ncbi:DUF977 family protein, partial [Escherichia coli]